MNITPFYNFFLTEHGTHLSIGTAVALGYVVPDSEPDSVIIKGQRMPIAAAVEAGMIDQMAADYLCSLTFTEETALPLPTAAQCAAARSAAL